MQTVVLNADYSYLNTVQWQKAIKMIEKRKVEVLKESEKTIRNYEGTWERKIPLVLKLVYMVRTVYRNKIPYSPKNLYIRDRHTCQYCGARQDLTIDHVLPRSRGGKTTFKNCVVSCKTCNIIKKRNRTPEEAGMKLKRQPYEPTVMEFLTYKMKSTGVYKFLKEINVY